MNTPQSHSYQHTLIFKRGCYFLAGFILALAMVSLTENVVGQNQEIREEKSSKEYLFISPLLFCQGENHSPRENFSSIELKTRSYINTVRLREQTSHVSVYYRDLNNGPWFGINEDEKFFPASLLKVPLMMSVIKENEEHPGFIKTDVEMPNNIITTAQHFPPANRFTPGKSYTIEELMVQMIIQSDNEAAVVLASILGKEKVDEIYATLGLTDPYEKTDDFMTVKNYAAFFRILYNATYLDWYDSNAALTLLSKTAFTKGLRAGIPKSVAIAHKFGETESKSGEIQLHDCGIVYQPRHPYLLCVMTRGNNIDTLTTVIQHIASTIHTEVSTYDD